MNNKNIFREINEIEQKIIKKSLLDLSLEFSEFIDNISLDVYVNIRKTGEKRDYPQIFLIPKEIVELYKKFDSKLEICSSGIYFGFIKESKFLISLEGAEFLYKSNLFPKSHYIYVNESAEKSLLYGNALLRENVQKINSEFRKNDFLLILNSRDEIIAIGRSIVEYNFTDKYNPNERIAQNLIDKGYYLRKEQ